MSLDTVDFEKKKLKGVIIVALVTKPAGHLDRVEKLRHQFDLFDG